MVGEQVIMSRVSTVFDTQGEEKYTRTLEKVKNEQTGLTKTTERLTRADANGITVLESKTDTTLDHTYAMKKQERQTRLNMRSMHMMNMAVLGVNMSLLGISFQLSNLGFVSERTAEDLRKTIAPMQLMLSMVNLLFAAQMLWKLSIDQTRYSLSGLTYSMITVGVLMAMIQTKSRALKMILGAVAAVTLVLSGYFFLLAHSEAFAQAMGGPAGWATLSKGLIVAAAAGATLGGLVSAAQSKSRAFSGRILTSPSTIMAGETAEAIIPLQSPKAARMGLVGPGGQGVTIQHATFNVMADKPSTLYKEVQRATAKRSYETGR